VQAVSARIADLGHRPLILDSSRSDAIRIAIGEPGATAMVVAEDGEAVPLSAISGIWMRQKPLVPMPTWGPFEHSAANFGQAEWRTVLTGLEICTPRARWLNPPQQQALINSKPRQLALARSVGFRVPDTEITNDPKVVDALLAKHGRVIYKSLNWVTFPDQTGILTTEITASLVASENESIRLAPGIYQQFLAKDYEIRITAVGNHVFGARINTPKKGPASIDWRHAHYENIFELLAVSADLERKILNFQAAAGIAFGAYDLIAATTGDIYFVECNPAGQFLWLEQALALPISHAVATHLCTT
jgi:hypothetical protein